MHVGVGLPTGIPGADGQLVLEWARCADAGPFSSLGVVDRLAYDSYDPLIALAAAAAVTSHARLATTIVIGPLRNTSLLAKMAASIDALSAGRLVLGLSVGAREEDYTAAGVDYHSRGRRLEEQLAELRGVWEEGTIGPRPARPGGPLLLVGGLSNRSSARMARYADGYVHGGGPPRSFARAAAQARAAWIDAGRPGRPQLWAQGYFALGEDAIRYGTDYMKDYYAFAGSFAGRIAAGLLTSPQVIVQFIRGYEEAGCDELILFPTVADLAQLERLASVVEHLDRRAPAAPTESVLRGIRP
jgi:alkanesulfonate monooxygenase SsuD/methylene tetrahydromethanopterin reductase-like flavin-dependent oxidoreductase (luciferase family)